MILAVHSYPGGNDAVARHYPYWQKAGFKRIIGIGTYDKGCKWPRGMEWTDIGDNTYINGDALPRRLINTVDWLLEQPRWEQAAIIEYDTVIFRPLPEPKEYGMHMIMTGGPQEGRKGINFYHCPWLANRQTWTDVLHAGKELIRTGNIDSGSPDCFIGWLVEQHKIPVHESFTRYTRNTIEPPDYDAARAAYRAKCHAIHGLKTEEALKYIIS